MNHALAPITLQHVRDWLADAGLLGSNQSAADIPLERIATLENADKRCLSFLANPKYRKQLPSCRAAAVLLRDADLVSLPANCVAIVTPDPYLAYAVVAQAWLAYSTKITKMAAANALCVSDVSSHPNAHPSAIIAANSLVVVTAAIGFYAIISEAAEIGDDARIGAHCYIGAGARIGAGTVLHPRVTVLDGCVIGERCVVHSGAVIGADGFGFAPDTRRDKGDSHWVKIVQLGAVVIGDDVEIGANTTIDRGALSDTVIGNGVKIDNQVQIGHNVRIGEHSAIAGCAGIAGSAVIGAHCTLGGGAIVLGHLTLADNVQVSAATVVTRSINTPGTYTGVYPFDDNRAWEKSAAVVRQLSSVRERLRHLENNKS